jgi:hypothetical protein
MGCGKNVSVGPVGRSTRRLLLSLASGSNDQSREMRTVEMRLQPQELSEKMAAMRMWLDERRFEPSSFTCNDCEAGVLVRVDFKVAEEADAFSRCFGGGVDQVSAKVIGRALVDRDPSTDLVLGEPVG